MLMTMIKGSYQDCRFPPNIQSVNFGELIIKAIQRPNSELS